MTADLGSIATRGECAQKGQHTKYSGSASQYINADSWDQQITTDTGNDLVIAGQWELPAGASDADIVNSGAGSDLVFTGQGRDIIDAGAGDDFIMSGGLATVASMQSEDPANQVPAGATWVRAGLGSWGAYNDSVNGDLGGRLMPYGITTAQFWKAGATDVPGNRPQTRDEDCQEFAIEEIANNDHSKLGIGQFDWENRKQIACGARFEPRHERQHPDACRVATNDAVIRSAA
jgi:hypothetical protein